MTTAIERVMEMSVSHHGSRRRVVAAAAALLCGGVACDDPQGDPPAERALVAGAGYSTFDQTRGGCLDSKNGVDCNNYEAKDAVYMSGGPIAAGLSNGDYFFAVLTPGSQNGGFLDGAVGNLSDTVAGGTAGDMGRGDSVDNRTFRVEGHAIVDYAGTHAMGTSPQGKSIIQIIPFDDTDNPGGVYILAICTVDAVSPSDCKFDAFRINEPVEPPSPGVIAGGKYYDANTNGVKDDGEPGLGGWRIDISDGEIVRAETTEDGSFSVERPADTYTVAEVVPVLSPQWMQTGNVVDQSSASGGVIVVLEWDKSYTVTVVDGGRADGLWFGNVCLGAGGGKTLGFWSNKNGALLTTAADLTMLAGLNLRSADGSDFDPATQKAFAAWLLAGTATNMANMLSVQLAAMAMNVQHGMVSPDALIYAPGTHAANVNGFASVQAVIDEADESLGNDPVTTSGSPARSYQEALKNALDKANNNRTFAQPTPATCPTPLWVEPLPV